MAQHARLSPSGADRWTKCTGSVKACLEAEMDNPNLANSSNIHSDTGTLAHMMAEICINYKVTSAEKQFANMGKEIDKFLEYVRFYQSTEGYLYAEQRMRLTDEIWGTADIVIFDKGHLHIIDLKYGARKVKAEKQHAVIYLCISCYETL